MAEIAAIAGKMQEAGGTGVPALPVSWVSELNDAVRGAPGRIRTCDLPLRRRMLCPLSYWSLRQV